MITENTTIVTGALAALVESGDVDSLARLLHDDFRHHRPDGTATKDEWLAAVAAVPLQDLTVEMLHVVGAGDIVAVHSRREFGAGGPAIVVVDFWRLEHGLITEGWEIIEPADEARNHETWWQPGER